MLLPVPVHVRPRVVLGEFEDGLRRALLVALRQWGYAVIDVSDGAIALAVLLSPGAPTLALLDWHLPGMTGPEICRRVRTRGNGTAFLCIFTGSEEPGDLEMATEAGANALLRKPCDLGFLKALLDTAAVSRCARS